MRIAVMGSGGVGGYFGARLTAAGHDVSFIARGAHLEALKSSGLHIRSQAGDLDLHPVTATDRPAELNPADAVIFAVKLNHTETAADACRPLLKEGTAVFTFQNGIDSAERIGAVLGHGHVVPGVAYIAAVIEEPGLIRHTGTMARLIFGESDGRKSDRVDAFRSACVNAGLAAEATTDIREAIWQKFIRLAPFSAMTALTRHPIGPIRENPETRLLLVNAIEEAIAVADGEGLVLADTSTESILRWIDGMPGEMTSSMSGDLARGKPLELDWLSGAVRRLGDKFGLDTPVHSFVCAALALHKGGDRS